MPDRQRLVRRVVPIVVGVLLVTGGSVTAWASTNGPSGGYRTVTVGRSDVEQTLALSGTVSAVSSDSASFPVSGTVASVSVAVGDTVTAGQEIARIDTTDLARAVVTATADVQTTEAALAAGTSTTSSSTSTSRTSGSSGSGAATSPALNQAQQTAQRSLKAATTAATAADTACASAEPSPSATPSVSPTTSATATATPPASSSKDSDTDCATALATWQAALQQAANDQQALAEATAAASTQTSPSGTTGTGATGTGTTGKTASGSGGPGGSELAVLKAKAALATAQTQLAGAVLTSPIAGTVASLPFTVGTAEATSDNVSVVGAGAVRVTVDVPLRNLPSVKVGQVARVTADGATTPVDGTVESISLLPSTSTTSATASYPVVVLVPAPTAALASGATAGVRIVLSTAQDVITVPNSALTSRGTGYTVRLVKAGRPTVTVVDVGAKGSQLTEVTSGVAVGDQVVVADLSAALPASSGELTTNRFGGGNFPQGGPRAGFSGGGAVPGGVRPGS